MPAEWLEPGVHLRCDGARMGPRLCMLGPQRRCGKFFGEVLEDSQRLPNHGIAVNEHRDFACPTERRQARLEIRRVERNHRLIERDARDLHGEPRPKRP